MYLVPNIHPGTGGASPPTVQANFATSTGDWTTVSTLSSMPSDGSITRSGQAMLYDSTGKLTYAPNNLLTKSQTISTWGGNSGVTSTANATTAPDGTTTASLVIPSGGTAQLGQPATGANALYIISIYAKAVDTTNCWLGFYDLGGSAVRAYFNVNAGTVGTVSGGYSGAISAVGNGWYRITFIQAAAATNPAFYANIYSGNGGTAPVINGTSGIYFWGAQLEAVTYQTTPSTYVATTTAAYYGPRFDYDPSTLAAKGLLIEGARTNYANASNQITSATYWTPTSFARNATITGPDGVSGSAQQFLASAGAASHSCYSTSTITGLTSGGVYAQSIYAKPVTNANYIWVSFNISAGNYATAVFDLSSATTTASQTSVGSTSGAVYSTSKQNVGNGWYKLTIVASMASTSAYFEFGVAGAATGNTFNTAGEVTFAAAGTEKAAFYGPQLELGAFSTSYIPNPVTVSTGTARAAETFAITGYSSNLINATYIDEATGITSVQPYNAGTAPSPSFSWLTSLRAYTNAYAGSISSPSWLSFTRNSNAMMTDSTGKLTWAPVNILTYSEDFSNDAWVNAAGGATISRSSAISTNPNGASQAISTYTISAVTGANNAFVYEVSGLTARVGESYVGSVWIRGNGGTSGTIFIYVADAGTAPSAGYFASGTVSFTGSWQRFSVKQTFTAATGSFVYFAIGCDARAGNTSSAVVIDVWGAQLERVTYQTAPSAYIPTTTAVYGPRYDYDASTVPATPRGLLIEESRANLVTNSAAMTTGNWASGIGVTTTQTTISPDGTNTAYLMQENTANSTRYLAQATSAVTASAPYTLSVYIKYGGTRYAYIQPSFGGSYVQTVFDFNSNTIVSGTGTVTNVGNGWYRISTTYTPTTTAAGFNIVGLSNSSSINTAYTGNGVSGVFVWGAQLEQGSFATSYILTTTASVTRNADVAQLTGSALTTLQGSSMSAIVDAKFYNGSTTSGIALGGPAGQSAILYAAASTQVNNYSSGASPAVLGPATAGTGTWENGVRVGISNSSAAGRSLVMGAGTVVTSAGPLVAVLSSVQLGSYASGVQYGSGWYRSFAAYNQKLPDSILKQKSVIGAPY